MKSRLILAASIASISSIIGLAGCSSDSKSGSPSSVAPSATSTTVAEIPGVQTFTGLTRTHVPNPTYTQSPPVGGDHLSVWQNCGVYNEPVADGNAVHSLEHGAVWIAYRPGLAADQVAVLAAFALNQTHILVTPYTGLTDTVVLTAWGKQLRLESVTDPRIAEFVTKYQEGPQTPELGVTCSGGVGNPIG